MNENRRNRLQSLLHSRFHDDRASFLQASGISKGRLSQLLQAGGIFGERAARSLEEKLNLPPMYFDFPPEDPATWPDDVKQIARAVASMSEESRRRTWAVIVALQATEQKPETGSKH